MGYGADHGQTREGFPFGAGPARRRYFVTARPCADPFRVVVMRSIRLPEGAPPAACTLGCVVELLRSKPLAASFDKSSPTEQRKRRRLV